MARIYKESRYVLQLLIGKSYVAQYDDVKISFYTKNPSNQVMVDNGITIKRNIAEVMVESTLFDNLEEGLISYIVYGTKDGIPFIEERQSNYFLKAPLDFKPTTCILEDKSVTPSMGERNNDGYIIVEEGEGYDGLSRVVIDPQTLYNEGYGQGKTDGVSEQKSKLESINITENGTYSKEDGYNHIEVNVPDLNGSYDEGYNQGKTDGANEQKGKLESINITENGTYTKEDGYNHIEVNVPDLNGSYNEGKTDGVNEQKGKLTQIRITENGTYAKEDGYSEVVVDVPDLNGSYDEGYTQGKIDGANEQKSKLETISITENGTYSKEDGYNQIEVNVNAIPKINIQKAGIKFGESTFTGVPEWADFEGVTDMSRMFQNCFNLQTIPQINTSKVTTMVRMFNNCSNLQTISPIDTSKVTNMNYMFYYCSNLRTLPELDASKVTSMLNYLMNGGSKLTNVGGWKNLKCDWNDNYGLKLCPNLTRQSCINILNGLYDFTGNGETPSGDQGHLKVHQNFLDKVGNEISIGTNKGWTITA